MVEICNHDVPFDWKINYFKIQEGLLLIMGYGAITNNYDELIDIIERKEIALRKFVDYKDWLKKWCLD